MIPIEANPPARRHRCDLRAVVALEWLQIGLAIVAFVAIVSRVVVSAADTRAALSIVAVTTLVLAFLALAVRARMAHQLLRRDRYALELRRRAVRRSDVRWTGGDLNPYVLPRRNLNPLRLPIPPPVRGDRSAI